MRPERYTAFERLRSLVDVWLPVAGGALLINSLSLSRCEMRHRCFACCASSHETKAGKQVRETDRFFGSGATAEK